MTAKTTLFSSSSKLVIGVAAASAIILAACITGLPAATCTAMAEAYARAIAAFGSAALVAASMFAIASEYFPNPKARWEVAVNTGYAMIVFVYFFCCCCAGLYNIQAATTHCFIGSGAQLAIKWHQRIPLAAPWDVGRWSKLKHWDNI
jgi:Kef-type K+ transport system membrane component KefB